MHNSNAYKLKLVDQDALSKRKNVNIGSNLTSFSPDKKLWKAFKKGDEEAFIIIYEAHIDDLYSFGMQYCNKELVEDLIQDLFIQLREKRSGLPNITNSIRLFLFQCLKRRIFNYKKKRKPITQTNLWEGFDFEMIPPVDEALMMNEQIIQDITRIDAALQSLSKKHREIIYYYFYLGMSYDEIKELLGYSNIKSARNMVYKTIKLLKKKVSKK
ncbi:RNA polymerase sigma factor [Galbibacter sp.]|uniref:RNA polymerase sigma factor n=1 Tax=Galbibacter sp. TaxID=2918471 RepID=UPI003A95BAB8